MKKIVIIGLSILIVIGVSILGVNRYKVQDEQIKKYCQIALEEQQVESEQRELERNSNFYEKLEYGFDTHLLVLENSMSLSEGASNDMNWINVLKKKIESNYESYVWIKNLAFRYTGYDVGFTQIAALNDSRDYDAVMICYPACVDEKELTLYEAILAQIKKI